jgi:DNA processing protein
VKVDETERRARIVLGRICEPGDADASRLVAEFSAVEVVRRISRRHGDRTSKLTAWRERLPSADYDGLVRLAGSVDARFICPGDDEWPSSLVDLDTLAVDPGGRDTAAPFGLWVRGGGSLRTLVDHAVAVVGSRASSAYGDRVAGQIAYDCTVAGLTVVSGGAYGIDAAAHRGALAQGGPTVAVLGCGIEQASPTGNAALQREITGVGLLVSEVAPGVEPRPARFLVRNRLIAAMTRGTVVVEAAVRSGSLNTARWARDLSRLVMGVPGPVTSATSAGVHELLRQPDTVLVGDGAQVIELVAPLGTAVTLSPR